MFAARVVEAADVFEEDHFDRMRLKWFHDTEYYDLRAELARECKPALMQIKEHLPPSCDVGAIGRLGDTEAGTNRRYYICF